MKSLIFGTNFNKKLQSIPEQLIYLRFGYYYDQNIDCLHKTNIKTLIFDNCSSINFGRLPHKLNTLILYSGIYQSIDNLPTTLTYLELHIDHSIVSLPPNLEYFIGNIDVNSDMNLSQLRFVTLNCVPNINSSCLTRIIFNPYFNQPLTDVPSSVTHIVYNPYSEFNSSIDLSNSNVKYLKFGYLFDQPINKENCPSTLEKLYLGRNFNQRIDNLPDNLIKLDMSNNVSFTHTINCLPSSLRKIYFGKKFNHSVDFIKSNRNLTHLTFGDIFNYPLVFLPKLIYLELGENYNHSFLEFTPNIETLIFNDNHKILSNIHINCPKLRLILLSSDWLSKSDTSSIYSKYDIPNHIRIEYI